MWWVLSTSLTVMSLLIFVGVVGLKPLLWGRFLGKSTILLVIVVALGVVVWNEVDALTLHSISALIAFGLGWVAMVLFGLYGRKDARWGAGWSGLSLLGGVVSLIALVLYVVPTVVGRANVPGWVASVYPGGSERAIVVPLVIWLVAIGLQLLRGVAKPGAAELPAAA